MSNSEEQRVEAEEKREKAEKGRAHAESNQGSGRVEAEEKREKAEKKRSSARNRAAIGYAILSLGVIAGIWGVSQRNDSHLRRDINRFAVVNCISSIPTYKKFNDLVHAQIISQMTARSLNVKHGRNELAKLNDDNIARFKLDLLVPPTEKQCQQPILRP